MGTKEKLSRERIRRINEEELNRLLGNASENVMRKLIRKKLPDPSKVKLKITYSVPKGLDAAIRKIGILDEPDPRRRMRLFVGYCLDKNYTYNTTIRYINVLKSNKILGTDQVNEENLMPDKFIFSEKGRPHTRIVSIDRFVKLINYLHRNFSAYTAPLLVAYYTGLRNFEILQWSTVTLYQLKRRQTQVSIKRKNTLIRRESDTNYWEPVYTSHLNRFVDNLIELYQDQYNQLLENSIKVKLFLVLPNTLVNRVRECYYAANNQYPPLGFGIHSYRNMMATLMSQNTDNITAIQTFLQHRSIETTRQYINADFTHTKNEFDRLTKYHLSGISKHLEIENK